MGKNESPEVVKAAIGLAARAGEFFEELVERGRLRSAGSRDYLEKVLRRARGEKEDAAEVLNEIMNDLADSAGLANKKDINDIRERLSAIEEKIQALGGVPGHEAEESIKAFRGGAPDQAG